jgi:hypothetical protein
MSGQLVKQFWTFVLDNDSITITSDLGLSALSIVLVSGTGTVQGGLTIQDNSGVYASVPLDLVINQPILLPADGLAIISNIEIVTNGVINLVGK